MSSATLFFVTLAILFVSPAAIIAKEVPLVKTTYVYKQAGDVKVELDVHRADDKRARPVLVYIHGGALINGSRKSVPGRLLELCRTKGYALVSIDYRLAPEVPVKAIIEDVQDAIKWVREKGPKQAHLDATKLVISGGSAGGYLTMMTGIAVKPRPTALVAYWGYGDIDGDWYTKPHQVYRKTRPLIEKEAAYAAVRKGVISGVTTPEQGRARGGYYMYLRQNGLWAKEIAGYEPGGPSVDQYCPVRNITSEYPPIIMVHGTDDHDVPYSKSADMAKELKRHKVAHELVTVPNAGHGLSRVDRKLVDEAHAKALVFIEKYLGK